MDNRRIVTRIIEEIRPLAEGFRISIADANGVVLASTDSELVGKLSGSVPEDLLEPEPEGMDVTAELRVEGTAVGMLRVKGPGDAQRLAGLLRLYVEEKLSHAAAQENGQLRGNVYRQLLLLILYGSSLTDQMIRPVCRMLGVQLKFPMRAVIVRPTSPKQGAPVLHAEAVGAVLLANQLIMPQTDLYGAVDGLFVLLHHVPSEQLAHNGGVARRVLDCLEGTFGPGTVLVARGGEANLLRELPESCSEALCLIRSGESGLRDIGDNATRMVFLMGQTVSTARERHLRPMYEQLVSHFGLNEIDSVMETLLASCEGQPLEEVARRMGVHRNTLGYRMKKILSATHLEGDDAFTRGYFIRMLLLYHQNRHAEGVLKGQEGNY